MANEPAGGACRLNGRLVVEIECWERWQHLGLKPPRMPRKYSFQGGLTYSPSFDVRGRVVSPTAMLGKRVRTWISPTGRELKIGPNALWDLGQVLFEPPGLRNWDISLSLLLPASATAAATTALASVWRYIRLSTCHEDAEGARVTAFEFAAEREGPSQAQATCERSA
jgi:hypothetical protein